MAEEVQSSPIDGTVNFFSAMEIVVKAKKLSAKKAEAWLKERLADGRVSLIGEGGFHLTPDQFSEQIASVE